MIQILSKEEVKEMNRQMVVWVRKTLKGKHWTYIYNILLQLKHWTEEQEREK